MRRSRRAPRFLPIVVAHFCDPASFARRMRGNVQGGNVSIHAHCLNGAPFAEACTTSLDQVMTGSLQTDLFAVKPPQSTRVPQYRGDTVLMDGAMASRGGAEIWQRSVPVAIMRCTRAIPGIIHLSRQSRRFEDPGRVADITVETVSSI